jgi:hypothetical protein
VEFASTQITHPAVEDTYWLPTTRRRKITAPNPKSESDRDYRKEAQSDEFGRCGSCIFDAMHFLKLKSIVGIRVCGRREGRLTRTLFPVKRVIGWEVAIPAFTLNSILRTVRYDHNTEYLNSENIHGKATQHKK